MTDKKTLGDRDFASLRFIGRHNGIMFYLAWSLAIYGAPGKPVGAAAAALERMGYLRRHMRAIQGGVTYVTITEKGAGAVGVPAERAKLPGPASLDETLATIWFSAVDGFPKIKRQRVEVKELRAYLPNSTISSNVQYVFTEETGRPTILRVIHAGDVRTTLKKLKAQAQDAFSDPGEIATWIRERDFGFSLLCPTEESLRAIRGAIRGRGFDKEFPVVCGLAPVAATLNRAIKIFRRKWNANA